MKPAISLAVSTLIVVSFSCFADAQSYSVANISSGHPSPRSIENRGRVTGVFRAAIKPPQLHAFLWGKTGGNKEVGAIVLGTSTLANGVATITTSTLTVGQHKIFATYAGDAIYAANKSLPLTQVVTK
jgi:hypothetical protein